MKKNKILPCMLSVLLVTSQFSVISADALSFKDLNPVNLFKNPFDKNKDPYEIENLWELKDEKENTNENAVYKEIVEEAIKSGKNDFSDPFYKDLASIIWNNSDDPIVKIIKIEKIWNENISEKYPFYLEKWLIKYNEDDSMNIIIEEEIKEVEDNDKKENVPSEEIKDTPADKEKDSQPNKKEEVRTITVEKFEQKGDKYFKETILRTIDSDGNIIKEDSKKQEITKEEASKKANFKDDLISSHKNEGKAPIEMTKDEEKLKEKTEVQIQNQKTIFYTLNADEGYPQYSDTGVLSLDHEKVAYVDVKDALKIITKKTGTRTFDDGKSIAFILNGKVIFLDKPNGEEISSLEIKAINKNPSSTYKNEDGTYNIAYINIDELNSLLDSTNVKFQIQDTRDSATLNLVDYIERGGTFNLYVNSEEVKLQRAPIIENSKMLFSIREIATKLGATVEWDEKTREATIKNANTKMVFKEGDTSVLVNDKKEELGVSIKIDGERMFAPVKYIVEQLGADMKWDAKKFEVHIDKKQ